MTGRVCAGCGEREQRRIENGRPFVNLDPILSLCVTCLVAYVKETRLPVREPFDPKRAAANDGVRE